MVAPIIGIVVLHIAISDKHRWKRKAREIHFASLYKNIFVLAGGFTRPINHAIMANLGFEANKNEKKQPPVASFSN